MAGHDAFRLSLPGSEDETLYIALPDETCLFVTPDRAVLARTLAQADRGRADPPKALADLALKIDATQTPLWVVGAPKPTDGLAPFSGGLTLSDGLRGSVTFKARTAEEAMELESDLREVLEAVVESVKDLRQKGRKVEPLVAVLQKTEVKREGAKVEMRLEVNAAELRRWLAR